MYAKDYDPSRNFFEQFRELQLKVPHMNLVVGYDSLVNSEYVNHAGELKDCYLIFNTDLCENVLYSRLVVQVKDSTDLDATLESELCYQDIVCFRSYRLFFSEHCTDCHDVYFSKNLEGCSYCFGCINLRNKKYYIFNKPHTKEDYQQKLKEFRLDSFQEIEELRRRADAFWLEHPQRCTYGRMNVNSSGEYVFESRNAHFMYQVKFVEDGKYGQFLTTKPIKDIYDYTEWGSNAQRICDCITVGLAADNIRFCYGCWDNVRDLEYCMYVVGGANLFGCVGLRKKQYCILNKQYTKEEFEKLRARIIRDMTSRPYQDQNGRIYPYGEFFPPELSFYDANETTIMDYYPLTKEDARRQGLRWRDPTPPEHTSTIRSEDIPDSISEVTDAILNEILECSSCKRAFRLVKAELGLLRRFGFPIPRQCPECRQKGRLHRLNPPRLWDRTCAKCGTAIKTSYAPERPEIVYCESCYQQEVV